MKPASLLLLYGVDEQTLPVDAECTRHTLAEAGGALSARGWKVETCTVDTTPEEALAPYSPENWIVFNLCEGSPSQPFYYARVAQVLEERGFAFTGSEAAALDDTQFKRRMKQLLEWHGVATPRWTSAQRAEEVQFESYPAIVKPADEHCSFGITRASVVFNLEQARVQAQKVIESYPGGVLVEEFLDGPEYGIALWGEEERLEILGISVIEYAALPDVRDRLCTFEAKWLPQTEIYQKTMPVCPAPLNANLQAQLESLGRQAYRACGLRDYGRIDVRMRATEPMVLDVNANCALSKNAGFPDTGRVAGWEYGAVLDRLACMAASRWVTRRGRQPGPTANLAGA